MYLPGSNFFNEFKKGTKAHLPNSNMIKFIVKSNNVILNYLVLYQL